MDGDTPGPTLPTSPTQAPSLGPTMDGDTSDPTAPIQPPTAEPSTGPTPPLCPALTNVGPVVCEDGTIIIDDHPQCEPGSHCYTRIGFGYHAFEGNPADESNPGFRTVSPIDRSASVCINANDVSHSCECETYGKKIWTSEEYAMYVHREVAFEPAFAASASASAAWSSSVGYDYFMSRCLCKRSVFELDTRKVKPSETFLQEVANAQNVEQMMTRVIDHYGTHYVSWGQLGGTLLVETTAKSCAQRTGHEAAMSADAVKELWLGSAEVETSAAWEDGYQGERTTVKAIGGPPNVDYVAWEEGLDDSLNVAGLRLTSLRCMIPETKRHMWDDAIDQLAQASSATAPTPAPAADSPQCRTMDDTESVRTTTESARARAPTFPGAAISCAWAAAVLRSSVRVV